MSAGQNEYGDGFDAYGDGGNDGFYDTAEYDAGYEAGYREGCYNDHERLRALRQIANGVAQSHETGCRLEALLRQVLSNNMLQNLGGGEGGSSGSGGLDSNLALLPTLISRPGQKDDFMTRMRPMLDSFLKNVNMAPDLKDADMLVWKVAGLEDSEEGRKEYSDFGSAARLTLKMAGDRRNTMCADLKAAFRTFLAKPDSYDVCIYVDDKADSAAAKELVDAAFSGKSGAPYTNTRYRQALACGILKQKAPSKSSTKGMKLGAGILAYADVMVHFLMEKGEATMPNCDGAAFRDAYSSALDAVSERAAEEGCGITLAGRSEDDSSSDEE